MNESSILFNISELQRRSLKVLFKEFIIGRESVLTVHFTRPGTYINHPLH